MSKWSIDKLIVVGLIVMFIVSIVASFRTGAGGELQATIAGGLAGYLSRAVKDRNDERSDSDDLQRHK